MVRPKGIIYFTCCRIYTNVPLESNYMAYIFFFAHKRVYDKNYKLYFINVNKKYGKQNMEHLWAAVFSTVCEALLWLELLPFCTYDQVKTMYFLFSD